MECSVVVVDEANTTHSLKLEGRLEFSLIILFSEAQVVVIDVLQLFLILLVRVVHILEHALVLRLSLY